MKEKSQTMGKIIWLEITVQIAFNVAVTMPSSIQTLQLSNKIRHNNCHE